jgi:hypothetical protein
MKKRKKKDKEKYLEKKKLKQEAKNKENNHKIDYNSIPDKNHRYQTTFSGHDSFTEMILVSAMMRAKKKNAMWGLPQNKGNNP